MQSIIAGIIRHIATIYAGSILAGGDEKLGEALRGIIENIASGDNASISGAIITFAAIAWSIYEKKRPKGDKKVRLYHDGDGIIREEKVNE